MHQVLNYVLGNNKQTQSLSYLSKVKVRKVPVMRHFNVGNRKHSETDCGSNVTNVYIISLNRKARGV